MHDDDDACRAAEGGFERRALCFRFGGTVREDGSAQPRAEPTRELLDGEIIILHRGYRDIVLEVCHRASCDAVCTTAGTEARCPAYVRLCASRPATCNS